MAAQDDVAPAAGDSSSSSNPLSEDSECYSAGRPNIVRLAHSKPLVPPEQLHLQSEQSDHSNFLLWQVYAFGGYLVFKWLWGKWKERQDQKGKPDK